MGSLAQSEQLQRECNLKFTELANELYAFYIFYLSNCNNDTLRFDEDSDFRVE